MPLFLTWICLGWFAIVAAQAEVWLGSDTLAGGGFRELQGKRVGLLTNPSGVNRLGQSTLDLLCRAPGVKLVALFAAEHGLRGDIPAGTEFRDAVDAPTGLPVFSLYGPGPTRQPTAKMLNELDALVYDIQDTGCRSYTFISTLGLAMEACGRAGVEFIVLDRPNPLGGERVEGPRLNPRFRSFVSQWDVPYVYGMTSGELARMINGERWIKSPCKLTVVPLRGWRRSMAWRDTGLNWVPTSPNVPRADSPLHYASTGLLGEIAGGSGLNIGGQFQRPFECVVAAWLDADKLSRRMEALKLPGVDFPTLKLERNGRSFQGIAVRFNEPARAPVVALNFHLLQAIKAVSGRDLVKEAVRQQRNFNLFDKVNGTDSIRRDLVAGRSARDIVRSWQSGEQSFRRQRQKYMLY